MKTRGLIFFVALFSLGGFSQGQDLFITFRGTSTLVDSVRVENITSGEKIMAGGNQVLRLTQIITEAEKFNIEARQGIVFSPNPMNDYSIMEFSVPVLGEAVISIIDLGGKEILKVNDYLLPGHHSYRLSGIKNGIYFVRVRSGKYSLTGTLVSTSMQGNAKVEYISAVSLQEAEKDMSELKRDEPETRGAFSEVTMHFSDGDSLKFTASSGNYRKVIFDVPDMSKTMTFDFFECTDGDNNEYSSVKIGNYIWMAENLRTTTFNDGTPIPYVRDDSTWAKLSLSGRPALSWYNNDEGNKNVYGGLYNMGVISGTWGKICPTGWHVAAGEWDDLFSYLDSAAAPDGEVSKTAGNLIKEGGNMHWGCSDNKATNETGFTALPGGIRKPGFEHLGDRAYFWDGVTGKFILYCTSGVVGHLSETIDYGLSVRCVKNSGSYISFKGSGAATSVTDVKVENLATGALITLKGNQTLYLGQEKGPAETIFMEYSVGQSLKFTGISGNYSTVMVERPDGNKTVTFNFIPCTDADGNNYPVVKIGEYTWMAENLKTTKLRNGTYIPYQVFNNDTPDSLIWSWDGYSWYNNDQGYKDTYGALYKMNTFKSGKLCPGGWHAPNHSEWVNLTDVLGGYMEAGGRLKETGTTHWNYPNTGATNESGFTALPGGGLDHNKFLGINYYTTFWSVTKCGGSSDCGWSVNFSEKRISWSDIHEEVGHSVRCVYGGEPKIPEVSTTPNLSVTSLRDWNITATQAYTEFSVYNDHGLHITQSGVCWSTSSMPTINDPHTSDGSGLMTGLMPGTNYYVRAYAVNNAGIGYGMNIPFTTKMADVEGNLYTFVQIGEQTWLMENLRSTKLNDGTPIQLITDDNQAWSNSVTPAYCIYPGSNPETDGVIYNWQSVSTGKLCPSGWHVPTDADWEVLTNYLLENGYNYDGTTQENKIARALSECCWKVSDIPGTPGKSDYTSNMNASGFSARPAGFRSSTGFPPGSNEVAAFWSSTPRHSTGDYYILFYDHVFSMLEFPDPDMRQGWSVRCLKDR